MSYEDLDIESITEARRNAIQQSLRTVSAGELEELAETLFPFHDHPWRELYFQFLKDNAGSTFYRAITNDPAEVIYCRERETGLWFLPDGSGLGLLEDRGLKLMKEIVERARA